MRLKSTSLREKQRGAGTFAAIFMVIGLIFIALFVVKVAPTYIDDAAVSSVLELVEKDDELLASAKKREIRGAILKRLGINQVRSVKADDIDVNKKNNELTVTVDYEVRTPLLMNLSIVSSFSHTFTKSLPREK